MSSGAKLEECTHICTLAAGSRLERPHCAQLQSVLVRDRDSLPGPASYLCINSWRAVLWCWRADAWLTGLALDRACHGFVCRLEAPHSGTWCAPALPPLACDVLHLARRFAEMLACTSSPTSKLVAEDKVQMDVLDTRTTPSTKGFARRSSSTS